ncbi:sulfite exporter TauE/SafE family protein [Natrononativus amylolyticus]|uniref:sulfite exporter TauE/SafE family protein n=1 Tax=Natrononativus amylolyticus TaxID=2963434 RepID=UPI0020CF1839|nr:sulfite exporter TauE/SafE family protein [Natrononativus amylolyticus]
MALSTFFGVDVLLFLLIGLLGGAHCIGMCGPLVTVYAERMGSSQSGTPAGGGRDAHLTLYEVRQHTLFNLGRTISYALLGGIFGAIGGLLFVTTASLTPVLEAVRGGVGLVVGGLVIATGAYYLAGRTGAEVRLPGLQRLTTWLAARIDRLVNSPGIMGLGAIHGLFPCPILYPAFLYAFATGSPAGGAIALGALGLGTIPAVFAYGTVIDAVDAVHRRRVHRLLGAVFIVLGYVLFAHGLMSLGIHLPHPELPFYDGIDAPGAHDHH